MPTWREAFLYFLFLGFVNVGGPVAQITMMYNHMVEKRRWLSREHFVKIMAFCHMLPGPEALLLAGLVNLAKENAWSRPKETQLGLAVVMFLFAFSESRLLQIAWLCFKTGLLSFGGAYAAIVFLQRGAVTDYGWLTDAQLLDGVALSVATPGPFMLFTTFAGYLAGGLAGAIVATFFVFLPSFVFVLAGARYVEKVQNNAGIQAFLAGVSAAVVGVIAVVSLELIPEAIVGWPTLLLAVAAFLSIVWFKVDVALVAICGIVGGVIYAVVTH
jgi:chromate transport protein ChrA